MLASPAHLYMPQRIPLTGGPAGQAGWGTVFPNEKRELSVGCTKDRRAGRPAAQKGGPAGYRKGWSGLQKRAALRPALFHSPA